MATYTDNFNRSNRSLHGDSNWVYWGDGGYQFDIVSNECVISHDGAGNQDDYIRWQQDLDSDDHYVQAKYVSDDVSTGFTNNGVYGRKEDNSTETYYCAWVRLDGSLRLTRMSAGSPTFRIGPGAQISLPVTTIFSQRITSRPRSTNLRDARPVPQPKSIISPSGLNWSTNESA